MGNRGAERWKRLMNSTTAREDFNDDHQITIDSIRQINVPTLALFGELSHCLETCRQLNQLISSCRVKILTGVGHFLPAIKPRLFMHTVLQFFTQSCTVDNQVYVLQNHKNFKDRRVAQISNEAPRPEQFPLNDRFGDLVLFDRRKSSRLLDSSVVSNQ